MNDQTSTTPTTTSSQDDLQALEADREALCGSLVSYPTRCNLWGDPHYRGNCDGRLVKSLILHYGAKHVADPMMGSGTTEDVVQWLNRERGDSIKFWGGDLRSGFNLLRTNLPGQFDFVWLHPPYWNIIRYSNHPDDLSRMDDYHGFRLALKLCLLRCVASLLPGGRLAVLVGDVRRHGSYTPIVRDVMNMEPDLGQLRSIIIKAQHHCRSDTNTYPGMEDVPIRHEYCLLFRKR